MKYFRRIQVHVSWTELESLSLSVFLYMYLYIPFKLIEKLFCFVVVEILSGIWAAYNHNNKIIRLVVQIFVSYRWLQKTLILRNPFLQVEWWVYWHVFNFF